MTNLATLGESFEASSSKENLLEIVGELSDKALELLTESGESLPIFGYVFKGLKAVNTIRDAFFVEKVILFLSEFGKAPSAQRQKMIDKINQDPQYRQKFGKYTVVLLDRYEDQNKAEFLGRAAKYLAAGSIDFTFYQRFGFIIDNMLTYDLLKFTEPTFTSFAQDIFPQCENLGLIESILTLNDKPTLKISPQQNPNRVRVTHRYLTEWGWKVRNILLDQPIGYRPKRD